jgi:NitT/TauT family transport system substrate-binding protein
MNTCRNDHWSRREFLSTAALAGAGTILGLHSEAVAAEPPPETTRIRMNMLPSVCIAPQYVAEGLLRAEGFRDVSMFRCRPAARAACRKPCGSA